MKKYLKIGLFAFAVFFIGNKAIAQKTITNEIKTKIYCSHCTQCETCGLRFDNELYKLSGLKSFTLVVASNIIKVSYNPQKITLAKIKETIANCGYDADDIKATEVGLNSLDGCCKEK